MKTGTGLFWLALVVAFSSMYEFEYVKEQPTHEGSQHHIIRYNNLTGSVEACVVDYNDDPWGSCILVDNSE